MSKKQSGSTPQTDPQSQETAAPNQKARVSWASDEAKTLIKTVFPRFLESFSQEQIAARVKKLRHSLEPTDVRDLMNYDEFPDGTLCGACQNPMKKGVVTRAAKINEQTGELMELNGMVIWRGSFTTILFKEEKGQEVVGACNGKCREALNKFVAQKKPGFFLHWNSYGFAEAMANKHNGDYTASNDETSQLLAELNRRHGQPNGGFNKAHGNRNNPSPSTKRGDSQRSRTPLTLD